LLGFLCGSCVVQLVALSGGSCVVQLVALSGGSCVVQLVARLGRYWAGEGDDGVVGPARKASKSLSSLCHCRQTINSTCY